MANKTGTSASEIILGTQYQDTLKGGAGNDTILGGGHKDKIDGGEGDDLLRGGTAGDTFIFSEGHGHDTVPDFNPSQDRIQLPVGYIAYIAQASAARPHVRIVTQSPSRRQGIIDFPNLTSFPASAIVFV